MTTTPAIALLAALAIRSASSLAWENQGTHYEGRHPHLEEDAWWDLTSLISNVNAALHVVGLLLWLHITYRRRADLRDCCAHAWTRAEELVGLGGRRGKEGCLRIAAGGGFA